MTLVDNVNCSPLEFLINNLVDGPTGQLTSKPSDYINCLSWLKDGLIICLTVCQTGWLSVCFIVCQTVCWTVFLTVCLNLYTTVCLNVHLAFSLTFWRTVCLTVCLTLFYTVSQTASKTICLTICLTSGHGVIHFQAACGDETAKAKWATNFLVGCSSCIDKCVFFLFPSVKETFMVGEKNRRI